MRALHLIAGTVAVLLSWGCGGGSGDATKPPPPPPPTPVVTSVVVSPSSLSLDLGASGTLAAEVRDQNSAVIAGKTPVWSSSSPASVTVDAAGVVRGLAVGSVVISATVDGRSGSAVVSVTPPAIAAVTVAPPSGPLLPGQTATLVAVPKDKGGTAITGRIITWSSSITRVATVDNAGIVTAVSPGSATITALSEGISGTATVVVSAPPGSTPPTIVSVTPATLTPGATATITGASFIATTAGSAVYVAGLAVPVQSATATQITVTIPLTGLPCQSTQPVSVEVTTLGGTAAFKHPLAVATTRTLAVGASFMLTPNGGVGCNEIPAGGTYLISVFNAARTPVTASFELKGSTGGLVPSAMSPSVASRIIDLSPRASARGARVNSAEGNAVRDHLAHLERGREFFRQYGPARNYRRPASASSARGLTPGAASRVQIPVPLVVGQNTTINFNYNSCSVGASPVITARVVYVGPKVVVLEDNAGVLAGRIDPDMVALATEFETISWPILLNFGDPLALDARTDDNGRVIMIFTPRVNNQASNLLGFVQLCDIYPTTLSGASASNLAEIFYARSVTDTSASSTSLNGRPQWKRLMPSTLVHETKHIISNVEREATPILTHGEEVWLEEGTAQLASEMFGRALHGNSWRSNAAYFGIIDCEVRPNNPTCNGASFIMGNHFGFLSDYLEDFENKSILGGGGDNTIYGSSWLFSRWLVDTYGGTNESTFLKKLILSFEKFGVDNVTAATGKSWAELLSQFTLMLGADDVAGINAPFTMQSWDLPAIFAGYNKDFPNSSPAVPLVPRAAAFGSPFTASSNSLKGGGAVLIKLTGGGAAPQMLELRGSGGAPLGAGSTVGMAVLRVQ